MPCARGGFPYHLRARFRAKLMTTRLAHHLLAICALVLPLVGCRATGKAAIADDGLVSTELGSMHNVFMHERLWFGGVPSAEDLDLAQRRGIVQVIDMCTPEEAPDYDLRRECQRLDLRWRDCGLRSDGEVPNAAVDLVLALLADPSEPETLMFCGDGSRCAMLFAVHRVVNGGLSLEDALLEARRAGMRSGPSEEFVKRQVDRLCSIDFE